ncbi:MAG TPA: insulinase family protein [Streptosporangiaceae bacterium]|nr:insulinase family protein [Streptosporangiaceae bacterium]
MSDRYACGLAFPHQLSDGSGVAHVVEHLVGHGPREWEARYLLPELTDRGLLASFTGLTYRGFTCYVMTGGSMGMDAAIDLLGQSCLDPAMDAEAIAAERGRLSGGQWQRGAVEDEVELRRSWLREAVSDVTSLVHRDEALCHDPAGRPDLLRNLTDETIRSFHRRWYMAHSMIACRAFEGEPLRQSAGRSGGPASKAVSAVLRSVVSDQSTLARVRKLAGNLTEPVVPEPWAARAILALTAGLAGSASRADTTDDELRAAIIACADESAVNHGDYGDQSAAAFAIRSRPGQDEPEPPVSNRAPKALPVLSAHTLEYSAAGKFALVVGTDDRCWPGNRQALSVRIYPAPAKGAGERLAGLVALWPAAAQVAVPRLQVSGTAYGPGPCAEWALACGQGQLGPVLARIVGAVEAIGAGPAADSQPAPPDPLLVAASLAGSAEARAALALRGHAIAGQAPIRTRAGHATGDLILIGLTGDRSLTTEDLRQAVAELAGRLHTAFARLPAGPASQTAAPAPTPVHRDEHGHWWLGIEGQPSSAPPLTVFAVQPHWAGADPARLDDLIPSVRRTLRAAGCYAIDGRRIEDWQLTVFTLHRAEVDRLAGTRLAEAVMAATCGPSPRSQARWPVAPGQPPGATPLAAAEALQRRLTGLVLPLPLLSQEAARPPEPSILLTASAGSTQ